MKIAIIGAGSWGVSLARVLAKNHEVTVWSILQKEVDDLAKTGRHPNLPGMIIPDSVVFTGDLKEAMQGAGVLLLAVPSPFVRSTSAKMKPFLKQGQIIVCVAKGVEEKTLDTMSEVITSEVGDFPVVALSGPTHAEEVALDLPTLIVSASKDRNAAVTVQNLFVDTCIRAYTNGDVKGVELCGALKNVIALACGIATGLGYQDNTKAAIITRGLSEMIDIGTAVGCDPKTFSGLAGVGDLIVTATSEHSRNNRCGQLIGRGVSVKEAVAMVGMVVEGINALPAAMELSQKYGICIPIIEAVNDIVTGKISAKEAVERLFSREMHAEMSRDC